MRGIDYSLGRTNIDRSNGIRYGVISANEILQAWSDSAEADYGNPTCPECGCETDDDYYCESCDAQHDSEDCYGDTPLGWLLDDGEYLAEQGGEDRDVFILRSSYFTRAAFCSPCAPGACYLLDPCDDGDRCYCFGSDWFDDDSPCPYPVYSVATGELIYSPKAE